MHAAFEIETFFRLVYLLNSIVSILTRTEKKYSMELLVWDQKKIQSEDCIGGSLNKQSLTSVILRQFPRIFLLFFSRFSKLNVFFLESPMGLSNLKTKIFQITFLILKFKFFTQNSNQFIQISCSG